MAYFAHLKFILSISKIVMNAKTYKHKRNVGQHTCV